MLALLFAFLTVGMPFWHTCQEGFSVTAESASLEQSPASPMVREGWAVPVHPCLACVWNRSTPTILLGSLSLALLGVVARLAGSLSGGRRVPCFVPSCGPRAPPRG